jgi:hypothetical protein
MSKVKVALLGLLVVFSASMVAAASASALEYVVEQKPLVGEEAIEGTSKTGKVEVVIAEAVVGTECSEDKISGALKEKGEANFKIEFKSCKVFTISSGVRESSKCKVVEPVVAEGKGKLISHGVNELKEFKGELVLEGTGCVVTGKFVVEGTQVCSTPEATSDLKEHTLTCTPAASELKLKSAPAQFFGEETIKLKNGKIWGSTIK